MDGWEVFSNIRTICEERKLPKPAFILLTGYSGQVREKERIAESGVNAVVDKPLKAAKLLTAVKEVVEKDQLQD